MPHLIIRFPKMNHVRNASFRICDPIVQVPCSLDSIGIAGFSHTLSTIHEKQSVIADAFDAFGRLKPSFLTMFVLIMSFAIPLLAHFCTPRGELVAKFTSTAEGICSNLLERTKQEKELVGEGQSDRSVIGLLSMLRVKTLSRVPNELISK